MLAQSFKSADELNITEPQKEALMKTLVLLETGKLIHVPNREGLEMNFLAEHRFSSKFNMNSWSHTYENCGTVCCIGGTAELIGNVDFDDGGLYGTQLYNLFYPQVHGDDYDAITPEQAATALRSYLTFGDPRWDLAVRP